MQKEDRIVLLVFIRDKKVKGHSYAYLVRNNWESKNGKVKQEVIKYLGKSSSVTLKDIPEEFQKDPNIVSYLAYHSPDAEKMELSMKEKMLELLLNNDIENLFVIFEKYSRIFGLVKFYERLLTPVMYKVGELWSMGKCNIATEHMCSNAADTLVKKINEKVSKSVPSRKDMKILICTPEGEFHSISCNVIESFLISKGYTVFNIAPSVPTQSVVSFIDRLDPHLIMISVTLGENLSAAKRLIRGILRSGITPQPLILVGGTGLESLRTQDNKSEKVRFLKGVTLNDILPTIKEMINDKRKYT